VFCFLFFLNSLSLSPRCFKDPGENYNLVGVAGYERVVEACERLLFAFAAAASPALYDTCADEQAADPARYNGTWASGWCEPPYAPNAACGL